LAVPWAFQEKNFRKNASRLLFLMKKRKEILDWCSVKFAREKLEETMPNGMLKRTIEINTFLINF
jgi:hypothetical protein